MLLSVYLLVLLILCQLGNGEILYKHCLGPADIGDLWKRGIYPSVCVKNHHFLGQIHAWSIRNSVVRNTTFSECKFRDNAERKLDFNGTSWEGVTFRNCEFGGNGRATIIPFTRTSMKRALFDGCIFRKDVRLLFEQFSLENSEFRNCTFESDVLASLGFLRNVVFNESEFSAISANAQSGPGTITFSQISGDGIKILNATSNGAVRFQDASISNFEIQDSALGVLACHEEMIRGQKAKRKSEFSETLFKNVSLSDGMYCDDTKFSGLHLEDIRIRNTLDLCKTDIENLVVLNVTSLSNETCSEFALCDAEVGGKLIDNITTSKTTFGGTVFSDAMRLEDFSVAETKFVLTNTVFTQEKINEECCTESCLVQGCKCEVSLDPLFCPRGNSSVNINVKDSCFPSSATVTIATSSGTLITKTMRELEHGDRVLHSSSGRPSEVVFFGHKTEEPARYTVLQSISSAGSRRRTLTLSGGHLLPVRGRGTIAARDVVVGDGLVGADGATSVVVGVDETVRRGMYAPATVSGRLIVDGFAVSCYTDVVPPWLAHAALAPVRGVYRLGWPGRTIVQRLDALHERSFAWVARALQYT